MTCLVFTLQEALQEQAKQKEELLKNFDTWKLEALSHPPRATSRPIPVDEPGEARDNPGWRPEA